MMVASWEGHLGIVETLLSADADPNLQEGVSHFSSIFYTVKEACNSFSFIWVHPFKSEFVESSNVINFPHTTPPFKNMIRFYILVGFQATDVTIAMVTQSRSV